MEWDLIFYFKILSIIFYRSRQRRETDDTHYDNYNSQVSYDNYDVSNNGVDVDDVSNNVVHHNDGFQNGFNGYGGKSVDGYGRNVDANVDVDVDTFHLPKKFGTDKKAGVPDNTFESDMYHFVTERSGSTNKDPDMVNIFSKK